MQITLDMLTEKKSELKKRYDKQALVRDGKSNIAYDKNQQQKMMQLASDVDSIDKVIERFSNPKRFGFDDSDAVLKYFKAGDLLNKPILESGLSFSEKRPLQKTVNDSLSTLEGADLPFAAKRTAQKSMNDALDRLDAGSVPIINPEPVATPKTKADVLAVMPLLKNFIGGSQLSALSNAMRGEEKNYFFDKLVELADLIEKMPSTYETDGQGDKAIAFLHYFSGGSDWYITEKDKGDPEDEIQGQQHQAHGYAILNGDTQNAESGYISIAELIDNGVELDLYWTPKALSAIKGKDDAGNNDDLESGGIDLQAMKNAVIDHGGEVTENRGDSVTFTLHAGLGGIALLSYSVSGEGYRVRSGENGINVTEYYNNPYDAVEEYSSSVDVAPAPQNQKLTDLLAGKYDDKTPDIFLTTVQDVVKEIKAIDPVKPAIIAYIQKAQEKGLISESALAKFMEFLEQ